MAAAEGFPGWVPLASGDAADVNALVSTLQTGDVLLSALDDDMGRYIQFAMDSPWSHAGVVLRLGDSAAGGAPNDKTEALLRKYPFRRRSHRFCAPGYCRCFDWAKDTAFAASCLKCPSGVLVLESTGEGIHVYDLAHRYFESDFARRVAALAVRRVSVDRTPYDAPKAAAFARKVRGSLYSTVRDELKDAIDYHADAPPDDERPAAAAPGDDIEYRSHFCSKVCTEFFQHMGWCDDARAPATVMPSDFDVGSDDGDAMSRDVVLADGAHFLPLQIIWTPHLGSKLPWRPARRPPQ